MPAPRAIWKGFLKVGSVACGVKLVGAVTQSEKIHFKVLNRKSRSSVKSVYVDEATDEIVVAEDQIKGFELDKGEYIHIEPDEIKKLKLTTEHTLEVESFVPTDQIDQRYLEKRYYLIPADRVAEEAFAVIREAAGRSLEKAVSATLIVADEEDFAGANEEWVKWFPSNPPARQGAKMPVRIPEMKVSVAMIAEA